MEVASCRQDKRPEHHQEGAKMHVRVGLRDVHVRYRSLGPDQGHGYVLVVGGRAYTGRSAFALILRHVPDMTISDAVSVVSIARREYGIPD